VSVLHARVPSPADSTAPAGERVPGLLEVLAQMPDARRRRGHRYSLVFVLAVATVCAGRGKELPAAGEAAADAADQKPGNPVPLTRHLWHAGPGARFLPDAPRGGGPYRAPAQPAASFST
jgi:hypothetical protein